MKEWASQPQCLGPANTQERLPFSLLVVTLHLPGHPPNAPPIHNTKPSKQISWQPLKRNHAWSPQILWSSSREGQFSKHYSAQRVLDDQGEKLTMFLMSSFSSIISLRIRICGSHLGTLSQFLSCCCLWAHVLFILITRVANSTQHLLLTQYMFGRINKINFNIAKNYWEQ